MNTSYFTQLINYFNNYTNYFNLICNYIKIRNTKTLPFIYKCEITKEKFEYILWYKNLYLLINIILLVMVISGLTYKLIQTKKNTKIKHLPKIQKILDDLDNLNEIKSPMKRKLETIYEINGTNENKIYTNELKTKIQKIEPKVEEFDIINLD